ncbi:MAG TPA: acetate--CoA ligase family protein [Methanoculleus sp.]|jgi:succinyl-CoA synthetase beta subunit|uniref:succinate--CoA ligase subunit beta n=2 Tax=Methanoculleus sp. TaxID=90427 RepID=UPI000B1B5E6E|nr:ATP-grasp domain-containing protein [Methanoculleus sp.]MBP7144582.1 acetate--CoA ligase family protein [Methanoculleus sp.]HNV37933.1 acetate--CoA ligase family protein [Methanoculleus sp.]HOF96075.1 acetate--CoA ligase family protein [Methanoculleus sp.]HOZ42705.1 acetate--CoA ligase family protein [Methanoculleus sp.]HPM53935.1 acetate--CoA ligase family protein [Methanoculleus sp.]
MKLLEYEAKQIFSEYGIPVPKGALIRAPEEAAAHLPETGGAVVLKAQVDVGGRGKAGGVLFADAKTAVDTARELFAREIKGIPVREVLIEERLAIEHEYYVSIAVDRSSRQPAVLFADAGGVEIESAASAVRKVIVSPLLRDIPPFLMRELLGGAPKVLAPVINRLYRVFQEKDAMLAEVNPLVTTPQGVYAADAKLIVDDNALARQGIAVNRDLSEREREAEKHGFSYVELDGTIGVIGNGAGLTMSTLDLIEFYNGRAANFLDVGGGADQERVMHAVRLVASMPDVSVIVVNLLGGITRCDEVAKGIIAAGVAPTVIVRMAGTNEAEGRQLLGEHGYRMLESMDAAVRAAMEVAP